MQISIYRSVEHWFSLHNYDVEIEKNRWFVLLDMTIMFVTAKVCDVFLSFFREKQ